MINEPFKKRLISQTRSVRDVIYEFLRDSILSGEYETGKHLKERELSKEFGVSTTPIKEAIRRLEQEGLVSTQARRGTFVSEGIMKSVEEITLARSSLEGVAVRIATNKITDVEIEILEDIIRMMKENTIQKDKENLIQLNEKFHKTITQFAKNSYIQKQIEAIRGFDRFIRKKALSYTDELERAFYEHKSIFDKIVERDPEGAEIAMINHIRRTSEMIQDRQ
ncbi:GntR family transcriptional regulator [Bacillus timonensis]|uniref:GntR family transcriptional regulator n=1 Tax=Bacillus timonensis TaxID=1033734 RepID=UPI0002881C29|nr:GntR family transcriptional regulator [Bacillus timonensis]